MCRRDVLGNDAKGKNNKVSRTFNVSNKIGAKFKGSSHTHTCKGREVALLKTTGNDFSTEKQPVRTVCSSFRTNDRVQRDYKTSQCIHPSITSGQED